MDASTVWDLAPIARVALVGVVVAAGPLAWIWLRHRDGQPGARLRALTLLTLFLTFDLIVFGAFTRLTDSGLGCPDWPGCYGSASPFGASEQIGAAQSALPSGPVTHGKAWIEMVHRYLATGVGVLITVLALASWVARRRDARSAASPWWSTATLVWVCVQGAFGALTVTMKLYPAIVTAHLLGGLALLVLLAVQAERYGPAPLRTTPRLAAGVAVVLVLTVVQAALGAWVSTNYAVLACTDFPTCHGSWWPAMDFEHGFALRRELGRGAGGDWLPFAALTAIHYTHRLFAWVVLAALALLAWRLVAAVRHGGAPALRRWAGLIAGVAAWQFVTGLSNVVLDWPIVAALAHTGGAAALVTMLTVLLVRTAAWPAHRAGDPIVRTGRRSRLFLKQSMSNALHSAAALAANPASRLRQFYALTKPRVVQLIVFCALIGMLLAVPGVPDWGRLLAATAGIWLVAGAAAAFNCIVEQQIDRRMARTAWRPTARGQLGNAQTLVFSALLCLAGSALLYFLVNPLTMWLTFATFVGYAVVYTVVLKPLTPQNIVIGGASGAMPPVLGWAAMRGEVGPEALMLCLIIFLWTPPHFWALALYRVEDYRRSGLPMLPVTHGADFTRLQVLLYTLVLFAATLLPFLFGMSGALYLVAAVALGAVFIGYAVALWRRYSDALARRTFRYSILYLALLFAALLVDHYLSPLL